MGEAARLNLPAIEASLRAVSRDFTRISRGLRSVRDPISDEVLGNMMAGYDYVDRLLAGKVELFTLRHIPELLEINNLVLCGADPRRRGEFGSHLRATERRFYEEREGGIRDMLEWFQMHEDDVPWDLAAGGYVRILSKPQLYIEGNHRSGALVMSWILARDGLPPFVLTPENAAAYFDPSSAIRDTAKKSTVGMFRMPLLRKRLAALLRKHANPSHLIGVAAASAAA